MFVKNILKAFKKDIQVKLYIDNTLIPDINTVSDFLNNGLLTYSEIVNELYIENNCIIIKL